MLFDKNDSYLCYTYLKWHLLIYFFLATWVQQKTLLIQNIIES